MTTKIGFADNVDSSQANNKAEDVAINASPLDDSIYTRPFKRTLTGRSNSSEPNKDGIYNMRDVTHAFSPTTSNARSHAFSPTTPNARSNTWKWMSGTKEAEDDDPGLQQPGDFQHKEVFHGKLLLWLSYQSIGAIYGDIGTSPLYVYSSTFKDKPSRQDLLGVLSIIIWSLILMVTVKYVLVILRADNNGEGGTFSTYSLLSRYVSRLS